ncbi:hypothetical protein [Streptomyces sp. CC208A]|uniref:hypothetical protein n=1 Tax=Streptomyces sp. CC208A TaxID=3044573 RepID=UPI0024A99AF3|nr:hypothetical protein [Streptomyces sp. CC208A]
MQKNSGSALELALTPDDQVTYKAIAAGEPVCDQAAQRLAATGLVIRDPYDPAGWVAIDPRAVAQRVLEAEQETLERSLTRIRQISAIEGLYAHFEEYRMYGGAERSELLPTMAQMNDRLGAVSALATDEICTVQPAPPAERNVDVRRLGSDRSLKLLRSGRVGMRLVYGLAALTDEGTRAYADAFMAAGGQIKVSSAREQRLVIVDTASLFIDDHVIDGTESHSGWHVRDRATVAWAKAGFERLWTRARWWSEALAEAGDIRLTARQLDILTLFDAGLDQPAAARELKLSHRTVSSELAEARTAVGVSTTNQLMAWYGRWTAQARA